MFISKKYLLFAAVAFISGIFLLLAYSLYSSDNNRDVAMAAEEAQLDREKIFDDIIKRQIGIKNQFNRLFDENFFDQENALEEVQVMRDQMAKRIHKRYGHKTAMLNPFDYLFADKFGGEVTDISTREDENFIYYDITINDPNSQLLSTKIIDGFVTITGTAPNEAGLRPEGTAIGFVEDDADKQDTRLSLDQSRENNMDKSIASQKDYNSIFIQTLPRPPKTERNNMQIINDKNKVILAFPKLKS